jgi:DNA modification methylase
VFKLIIQGDALTVLKRMDSESVHMAVTSSPYYGLRSYGTEPIVWDGDPNCQHEWISKPIIRKGSTNGRELSTLVSAGSEKTIATGNTNSIGKTKQFRSDTSNFCSKCGAWKGELGQEPTPEMFVRHLTTIFHELKRILRNDGIFWMNIGDSYAGTGAGQKDTGKATYTESSWPQKRYKPAGNIKPKDIIGIPWMLAFSMRADGAASPQTMYTVEKIKSSLLQDYNTWDEVPKHTKRTIEDLDEEWLKASKGGWYLRSDLVWIKRNSMPSSVTDRPGSSIEHVFLFSKSPKYYYDHIATMQKSSESYNKDKRPRGVVRQKVNENTKYDRNDPQYAKFETIADELVAPVPKQDGTGNETYTGFNARYEPNGLGLRYMRDSDFFFKTWQGLLHNEDGEPMALVVNPKGYKGAHFACVDSETECLTIGGWKRYDQIKEGTPIFTYNMKKACLEIQPIKSIFSYRYSGNLISVFGRSSNMLMTPNHRCVVTTRDKKIKNGRHPAKIVEASNLKDGMKFIVSSHLDFNPIIPNDPKEYYELLGWILSEGHFTDNGGIGISQSVSKNPQKCKRIQYLLEFLKIDFNTWQRKRIYKNTTSEEQEWKISGEYRKKIRHMIPNKYMIPEHFIMLPDEYIESFISGFVGGDGHIRPDGRITISQKSKQPLDIIQAMFLRTNRSCILSQRGGGMWSAFITHNKKDRCFKNSTSSLIHDNYSYDGIVWCPSVENGTFVARRGGRPFITGNSFPVRLVEPLILAGTSDRVCPKCGAPWVRVTKKESYITRPTIGNDDQKNKLVPGNSQGLERTGGHVAQNTRTIDWKPTCTCNLDPIPATVIDPFSGSSATGVACKLHNRTYIGIELNPEYVKLGEQRVKEGK